MAADLYFPVPLVVLDVAPALRDAIHAKVLAYLNSQDAKQVIALSPEESVETSYYRPETSILADAALSELEEIVIAAGNEYLEQTLKLPPRRLEVERAWINIFQPGAQEAQHTHDGSLLSCSYYVEAPEKCGCIVFPDPIGERRSYREFTQTVGPDLLTRRDVAVEVQPGRLVMFESWVPHLVQCNKSNKVRISIAVNLGQVSERTTATQTPKDKAPRKPDNSIAKTDSGPASERLVDEHQGNARALRPVKSEAKPFLFDELFDIRNDFTVNLQPIEGTIPTVVIDNVLRYPERAREIVGSTPAANWKHEEGGRNFVDYYDCRLRFPIRHPNKLIAFAQQAISRVYSLATRPADASVDVNWFMQINEKRADFATPHNDITEKVQRSFTCIVYLNSPVESSGGTAFFRFKKSKSLLLDDAYARAVQEDSRIAETGRDYWSDPALKAWEQVGVVDMVPGRLLIFPSEYFHAAYHPVNSFYEFPRMTLAFWMIC